MRLKSALVALVISVVVLQAQSPCCDSLFLHLKTVAVDSMTPNQLQYYLAFQQDCRDSQQATRPTQRRRPAGKHNPAVPVFFAVLIVIGLAVVAPVAVMTQD